VNEPMILNESPEAAQQMTITGWYDRLGRYFGQDERSARWSGCTHVKCSECGTVTEKHHAVCDSCHQKGRIALFDTFPVVKWDGDRPVVLFDTDRFFFGEAILDFIADSDPAKDSEIRICMCHPNYLHLVESDIWEDDLPEDGELPDDVRAAVDALNQVIKAAGPVSWTEAAVAIDLVDLRARVNTFSATNMSAHD
jgi:hypothetical protein